MSSDPPTPVTLLDALKGDRPTAADWKAFHRLYAPLLLAWARRQGFQEADALDVAQDVLLTVSRRLTGYVREPGRSFRAWLFTVTKNRAADLRRRRGREVPLGGEPAGVGPDLFGEEREFRVALVHRACAAIRPEFAAKTWEAFARFKMKSQPLDDVAAAVDMKPRAVYAACSRVMTRLRHVVAGFLDD